MLMDEADSAFDAAARTTAGVDRSLPLAKEVETLFDRWRAPLLGYVVTLRLPVEEGEDIVQEVFLSLFQHLRRGKSRENLRGWIFRVGHNLALKRREGMGRRLVQHHERDELEHVRDPSPNPESVVVLKERQARLVAVVGALSEQDRCCLYLRAEGLRYREIAEVLGISLGSVAVSLGRSLDRLRTAGER